MSIPPATPTAPRPRRKWPLALLVLLVAGVALAAYFAFRPKGDIAAAAAANARGVGHMERMSADEFHAAELEFAEAVRLAPEWLPARINLGIALFNQQPADQKALGEQLIRAQEVFREVLARDADNRHARYCLGMIDLYVGKQREAHEHFAAVNRLDPEDAHTWLRLGVTDPEGSASDAARKCFERALALNPYLNEARYRLALAQPDPALRESLLAEHSALVKADWYVESEIKYAVMGKYADVIGRIPDNGSPSAVGPLPLFEALAGLKVTLAPGARWALAADLDPTVRAARERFGGTVVLFDYNGDGRTDAFLASAVVEGAAVRDLLLRNEGNGAFNDATAESGLAASRRSLGGAAADFNNDGLPDFAVTGADGVRLYRNSGSAKFEDVTAIAGLDKRKGVHLGCCWLDVDQDGDLDLILCRYADGDAAAFDAPKAGGGTDLFENVGVAPPGPPNGPAQALGTAFVRNEKFAAPTGATVAAVLTDIDGDRDIDLLLLADAAEPAVIANDRLMRFRHADWKAREPGRWNGGLVLDANHDERSDLFLLRAGQSPLYWLSKGDREFAPGTSNAPALKQAVASDIDMDGWTDIVGLGEDGRTALLHNRGDGRLEIAPDAFGPAVGGLALAVADFDDDGAPDLFVWAEDGPKVYRNRGNGNAAVAIQPTGRRDAGSNLRTNADGIGTWLVLQSGTHWTGAERTTVAAGLGQSLLPTSLGIGKRDRADVLRVRWPDAVIQAELGIPAGKYRAIETNRKGTSCPVLMSWDGEKFAFVTDFLGGGALGESGPDGSVRPPRPVESVKIEPRQLVAKNGQYLIKIAEPMDEVLYLDYLQLVAIDHPADSHVFPDERFVFSGPEPTQKLLAFRLRHFPKTATDHRGRDVTSTVRERDRRAVNGFATRSWLGYAEDHSLTLDFPELPAGSRYHLVLAGWTEYPYPESMYAATRAGVALKPPVLECERKDGKWEPVCDLGFPAGLPRVMTRELPDGFRSGRLRIATNMQVYWDQVYVASAEAAESVGRVTELNPANANLAARGFMQEIYPDGRLPVAYDDAKTEPVAVTRWFGKLTRLGDVTELLGTADDRFAVCGPGDEITVRFDATKLPELKPGWTRSFVLRTRGYCKDTSTTTVTGGTVGPLPFRAMPNYPDFGGAKPPATDAAVWQTRPAGGR